MTLRLAPLLPTKVALAQFPNVEVAVNAVQEILNTPHGPHIRKSPSPGIKLRTKAQLTQSVLNYLITIVSSIVAVNYIPFLITRLLK